MFPPEPIIEQGTQAIISYYKSLERGSQPLNEVKILLVGDGAAGKTSLVKALLGKDFNEKESQTHGIQIQDSTITMVGEEITVHFWDFGGQEIMHATHQFFLTKDCVYVLVLDGRRDERPDYWLKHIDTFGKGAPVLVVMNKFEDNRSYDVVRQDLNSKYPNIQGYYPVSCKKKNGMPEFKEALYNQLYDLPFRKTPFNFNWSSIKTHLREMEEPFITYDVYYQICERFFIIDKNEQETLLNYLNALGIVLHFEVLKAFNTQVLNPLWLTQAVYRVINSSIISTNKGEFKEEELFAILNDEKYKEIEISEDNNLFEKLLKWFGKNKTNKRSRIIDYKDESTLPFIAKVMQQFELSYSLDKEGYIIPDLLPVEPLEPINYTEYDLHIAVDFYFLPPALMPRFMVQTHQHIKDATRWRTGVMLKAESNYDATGIVSIDKDSKRLHIYVKGNQKRELLTYIRSVLKGLYNSYEGLKEPGKVVEKLFLPERPDIEVELSEIEGLEQLGDKEYSSGKAGKKYPISVLLGGIQNPEYAISTDEKALKVFISYNRTKAKFREELMTMIHPLVHFRNNFLEVWHDDEILPGEQWKKEIDKALAKADLVICLISAEYLRSEWCMYELQRANELNKIIYGILINDCGWKDHPILKTKNGYYNPSIEPITKKHRPKYWMEIYQKINKLVAKISE